MAKKNHFMKQNPLSDKKFIDLQTDRRVHEILSNEKDEVTEADIINIKTDVTENMPVNSADKMRSKNPLKNNKLEDDTDPEIDNSSWNVLEGDN